MEKTRILRATLIGFSNACQKYQSELHQIAQEKLE